MTRRRSPLARRRPSCIVAAGALAVCALAACASDGPLAVRADVRADASIVGTWTSSRDALSPQGSWQRSLTITSDGRIARGGVSYGLYASQAPNDVSAIVTLYGRLDAVVDGFVVRTDSIVSIDRFYGPTTRTVERNLTYAVDTTRYVVTGDTLRLTFFTYPADAPVLTTETLYRATIAR